MKFDVIYSLTPTASIRLKLHRSIDSVLVGLYDHERMYFAIGLMPFCGSKMGQPVVAPLPWPDFELPTCRLLHAVFTLSHPSASQPGSLRFRATIQQRGQIDREVDEVLATW